MQKSDIYKEVAKETGIDLKTVKIVGDSIFNSIKNSLIYGLNVYIKELINFELVKTKAVERYDFKTEEKVMIPKSYRIKTTIRRSLREKIRSKTVS